MLSKVLQYMRVGFYVKPGKWDKMNMPHFVKVANKIGITIIRIDLSKSLDEQGPFDLIVHKSIDLFVQSNYFHNEIVKLQLQNFKNYITSHPEIPISNPLSFDELVTSRRKIFNALFKLQFNNNCIIPNLSILTEKYVIKPDLACGSEIAHKFEFTNRSNALILNENNRDVIVQPYFDTGNAVLKVYSIGNITKVHVINPDSIKLDYNKTSIESIADVLRNAFECDLFGFDLVREIQSGNWYIVDLNSFSGIEVIPGFEELLIKFFRQKLQK